MQDVPCIRRVLASLGFAMLVACDATSPDRTPVTVAIEGAPSYGTVIGAVIPLRAVARAGDGRTVALSAPVVWSSSDTSSASVDAQGVVHTRRPGTPTITVRIGAEANAPADSVQFVIIQVT